MLPADGGWTDLGSGQSLPSERCVRLRWAAGALPPQDGHLMSQGDELELQGEAITKPEREQGAEGGQKREHADDGVTGASKTLCFHGFLEF